jgi:hypothetical protein
MIFNTVNVIDKTLIPFIVLYVGIYFCSSYFLIPTWQLALGLLGWHLNE